VGVDWYGPFIKYLKKGYFDNDVLEEERSQIIIRARSYTLYDIQLNKLRPYGVLQQCLFPEEAFKILEDFYEGPASGHFNMNTTIVKVLSSSYWWPTMHKDVVELCQNYDICQRLEPIWQNGKGPFKPVMAFEPFMKWGFDFMEPVKLATRYIGNQYIIVATNYIN
jgi:hypothetical protein